MMLYTIGHSNRTLLEFISIAKAHNIEMIADVRGGRAGSRAFPHFNTENLAVELPRVGIKYEHFPELGGRRGKQREVDPTINAEWRLPAFKNYADYAWSEPTFITGLARLKAYGEECNVAYMCSEVVPWRCHRSIITDYFLMVDKLTITHIIGKKQTMDAKPHDHACLHKHKIVYPKIKVNLDLLEF